MKKGTLPLRWVSIPGPLNCRSNALSSELRRNLLWNLRRSDDRAFDRQFKGPGIDTQRNGNVPFFTEIVFRYQIGYWHPNMHMEETTQKDSIKERYKDLDSKEFFI